ncbi:GAF and ANTAR domain-containing protein [Kribbella sp. NBC_01245]|uniref:GAF and ANTAR domain-containing protein n=1 Tax=Kribbella sp. NBC_01245 TaxID=2903578 RepID=UPI002E29A9A1|nr:GAF and ANTAR domain-containing protein [Kribbella sp. NBC_01245]
MELHGAPTVTDTVEAVVDFALQAVNCRHAGVVLAARGGRAEIGAVTDSVLESVFQWQIDSAAGPLIESLRAQEIVDVVDTSAETRWPDWATKVSELGVGSAVHVPLCIGVQSVGVLTLYGEQAGGFSADDLAVAHILARHASVAVAAARQEETMARAVDARKLVGQAMGILMMKFDVDGDRAFAILKRYSQDHNRKLRDVAQEVIDTRKLPG